MPEHEQLRCLIAAGGTVGHLAPSLAVAETLRERGVAVTFAGSPDRVEARLVPEHGYAFDEFAVAGFPRSLGASQLRALVLAAAAPVACLRILERRKPDVVLGGGGYVAGPMVLAARLRRIPAALTEGAGGDAGPAVRHLCGGRASEARQGRAARSDYMLRPFIDESGLAYGAAGVAVARAGGSVWELAAAGLPAVLVPGEFATGG